MTYHLSEDLLVDITNAAGFSMGDSGRLEVLDRDRPLDETSPVAVGTWEFVPGECFRGTVKLSRAVRDSLFVLLGDNGRCIRGSIGPMDAHVEYTVTVTLGNTYCHPKSKNPSSGEANRDRH